MLEKCNKESRNLTPQKSTKEKYKDYAAFNDHNIFEGLDNSKLLPANQLKNETHKEIFLGYTRGVAG